MKARFLLYTLLLLVLAALAVIALRYFPFAEVWQALKSLSLAQILVLILLDLCILALANVRWWIFLKAQGHSVPFLPLLGYRLAGYSISYFSPGTQFGGEPLQVYLTQTRHSLPGVVAVAAVTLDKLFELVANFTFLALGAAVLLYGGLSTASTSPVSPLAPPWAVYLALGLLTLPLGYLLALWVGRQPLSWLSGLMASRLRLPARLGRLPTAIASAEGQASHLIRLRPLAVLSVVLVSGLVWVAAVAEYWLMLSFLGATLSGPQAISGLALARFSFLTPIPGALGALEASQALALQALGYTAAIGITASLLMRFRDISLGLLGLAWGARLTHRQLLRPLFAKRSQADTIHPQPGD